MADLGRSTEGQVVGWAASVFVNDCVLSLIGTELDIDKIRTNSKAEGSSALSSWFEEADKAQSGLSNLLHKSRIMYNDMCKKCGRENIKIDYNQIFELDILNGNNPTHFAKKYTASAVIHQWFSEQCNRIVCTFDTPVRTAQEFYLHMHKCWETISNTLIELVCDAFRIFGGIVPGGSATFPLTPAQVIFDGIFYMRKSMKIPQQKSDDPSCLDPTKLRLALPQSVKDMVTSFCGNSASMLPVATVDPDALFQVRSELLDIAWKSYFDSTGRERIPDTVSISPVPVSLVDHENWQLTFDRSNGIPMCINGTTCMAMSFRQLNKPLQMYLLPSEEQYFQEKGCLPQETLPGECLLCMRRTVHSVVRASSGVFNSRMTLGRQTAVTPLVQNLVDVPGGYKSTYCLLAKDHPEIIPVDVVGAHMSPLKVSF